MIMISLDCDYRVHLSRHSETSGFYICADGFLWHPRRFFHFTYDWARHEYLGIGFGGGVFFLSGIG